jgi:BirA family biotin operon repressor/biotin-[acetyl-CoA-carboxylase] ligase
LRGGLFTRVVGKRVLFFQQLGSTMDEAVLQAEAGAEEGTVVVAEVQTASRGRQGRTWVSTEGNLYLSVLFYPTLKALPFLSSLGGVAVVRTINAISGLKPRIKWPNDVLLDGKKVAGILVESAIAGDDVRYAVLGIGINVSRSSTETDELSSLATSLNQASSGDISREELLRELLQQLDALYLELRQGQAPMHEWQSTMDTLGRRVRVTWEGESYVGLAEGLDQVGNLQLRLDDGRLVTMAAGDAMSLR